MGSGSRWARAAQRARAARIRARRNCFMQEVNDPIFDGSVEGMFRERFAEPKGRRQREIAVFPRLFVELVPLLRGFEVRLDLGGNLGVRDRPGLAIPLLTRPQIL